MKTRAQANAAREQVRQMRARGMTYVQIAAVLGYHDVIAVTYLARTPPSKTPLSPLVAAQMRKVWLATHAPGVDPDAYIESVMRLYRPLRIAMARHFRQVGYSLPDVALITHGRRSSHSSVSKDVRHDAQERAERAAVRRAEDASR